MGWVGICQIICDLIDRLVRERKLSLRFGQDPLSYQTAGRYPRDALYMLVEMIGRHCELRGIEVQQPPVAKIPFDQAEQFFDDRIIEVGRRKITVHREAPDLDCDQGKVAVHGHAESRTGQQTLFAQ